jgi:hypothetical protein
VIDALLALEQGAAVEARMLSDQAEKLCAQAPAAGYAGQPIAAAYLGWLTATRP